MHLKKRMRTVIITGSRIKKIFVLFFVICFVGLLLLISDMVSEFAEPSGEVGIKIISDNVNDNKVSFKEIICKILGFNTEDEKTIFYRYYALFGEIDDAEAAVESAPPENLVQAVSQTETESAKEQKIEEVEITKGMEVSNLAGIQVDATALANEKLHIKINDEGPQVLIVHTHTTESFVGSASSGDRNTDKSKNMVAVGEVFKSVLEEAGIKTVHDTTVHDYPSYSGAYTRSKATVKSNIEKYPSIKVVLDVHRDGIVRDDGTKVRVVTEMGGKGVAQCMFVVGTNTQLKHDNWKENMRLACKLQKYANEHFPGLMRPVMLRKERFNQQISTGAIIVEVGSNGNTLEEAKEGAAYMAKTIAGVLKEG